MAAEQIVPPELEASLGAIIEKNVQARTGKAAADGASGVEVGGTPNWKGRLPPRPDQEMWDRVDPVRKGAGIDVVRWAKWGHIARSNGMPIEEVAKKLGGERAKAAVYRLDDYRKKFEAQLATPDPETKALAESTLIDGGALTPPEYSSEFLPLLRNATVVLESGARVMEMAGQILNVGRQNAAGTASYANENQASVATQQQFGQLSLAVKDLRALTGFSNSFLRDGGPAAEAKVRDDLIAVMGNKFDISALRADGTQGVIPGLRYLTNSANIFAATQAGSAATFQEISADLSKAKRLMIAANILRVTPMSAWGWVLSPTSVQYLESVSSTLGVYPFKAEMMEKGTLWGLPFMITAAIPENLGGGSNESEVYLCAWPQYLVGQNLALEVMFFPNGAAVDTSGSLVSGISSDLSWLRAIARHDTKLAYDKACVVITTVKWGR